LDFYNGLNKITKTLKQTSALPAVEGAEVQGGAFLLASSSLALSPVLNPVSPPPLSSSLSLSMTTTPASFADRWAAACQPAHSASSSLR
jgi:hypothetical protein